MNTQRPSYQASNIPFAAKENETAIASGVEVALAGLKSFNNTNLLNVPALDAW